MCIIILKIQKPQWHAAVDQNRYIKCIECLIKWIKFYLNLNWVYTIVHFLFKIIIVINIIWRIKRK